MLLQVDALNIWFVMLLLMLLPINLQVSFFESKLKVYNYLLCLLYLALLLSFLLVNIVLFFLLFELIIVVMFMLLYAFILSYYRLRSSY
jgi:NADH:ubiquinone oxidoreductase subunit 4 (subunit M)